MPLFKIANGINQLGFRKTFNVVINKFEDARKASRLVSFPTTVSIEITSACPLECVHCPRSHRTNNKTEMAIGHLSVSNFVNILDKLSLVKKITLQGLGEPLLHPHVFQMVKEAQSRQFIVGFSTSASYYNQAIEKGMSESPPDFLGFSVDSVEKQSLEEIRKNHRIERFIDIATNLIRAVRRSGKNTKLLVQCCLMKTNIHHLDTVIEFAKEMRIDSLSFSELNFSYLGSVQKKLALSSEDYIHIEKALDRAKSEGINATYIPVTGIKKPGTVVCSYLWREPYITWDGSVTTCCGRPFSSLHNVGNILTVDSFMEIWNGKEMQRLRTEIRNEEVPFPCNGCPLAEETPTPFAQIGSSTT